MLRLRFRLKFSFRFIVECKFRVIIIVWVKFESTLVRIHIPAWAAEQTASSDRLGFLK